MPRDRLMLPLDECPDNWILGTISVTVSMNPNPYAVSEPELLRSLRVPWRGGFLQDRPDCQLSPERSSSVRSGLSAPQVASGRLSLGPQSARVLAFSTLGFPHDRGRSNRLMQNPISALRRREQFLQDCS